MAISSLVMTLALSVAVVGGSVETAPAHHLQKRATTRIGPESRPLDRAFLGKGCSFCIQANFNFKANFDKLAQAIGAVASDVHDVEGTLQQMAANFTKEMASIAKGIEDLAHSIDFLGADMLLHIVAMGGFLNSVKAEVDLGILVTELQTAIARITHRQTLLNPLLKDKSALSPEQKQDLVKAILDINEGSDIDTQIVHDVMTGSGGVVPGVQPAMSVYMKKGYRLDNLAKVFGALFVYQMHGYGQLMWAYLNKRPNIEILPYNQTNEVLADRMMNQWLNFGSPFMWHCYWEDGFICPEKQECHTELRGLSNFTCNHATAPVSIPLATGSTVFTLGAASSNTQLAIFRHAPTGTCSFGVKDCSGTIPAPLLWPLTNATNFTCTEAVSITLNAAGEFLISNGTASALINNFSSTNHSAYALHIDEFGTVEVLGDGDVLWTHASPSPAGGPCPTDFSKRQLQALSYDSCSCITTARWRQIATGNVNMTASWCSRLCQADPQFVAAAPRVDGACWCGTPEVFKETKAAEGECEATCPYCPGAPIAACGSNNTVAIYTWAQPPVPPSQKEILFQYI